MPTTSVTLAWSVLAAAGQEAAEIQNDGLARNCSTLTAYQEAHGKKGADWKGAQYYPAEIITEQHTAITQFTDGFDPFAGGAAEVQRVLMYPFAVSGLLMKMGVQQMYALASSKGALRKQVTTLVAACAGVLKRAFEQRALAGTGTGFGSWNSLNGIDSTSGILEQDAFGSQTNTIGGLAKSAYATVLGMQNPAASLGGAFGSNLSALDRLLLKANNHAANGDGKWAWFLTEAGCANLKQATRGHEFFMNAKGGDDLDLGKPVGRYGGKPVYQNTVLPTTGTTTTASPMTALLWDFQRIFWAFKRGGSDAGVTLPDGFFGVGEWGPLGGLQSLVAGCPMMVAGNLIAADVGTSGIAYNGETY